MERSDVHGDLPDAHNSPSGGTNGLLADDGGFTQVGVVIALLLVVSLLFMSAQVYWAQSHSADIQYAADAAALAATNVVGEYLIVARVADAVVLSLSLTGLMLLGISAVAACIPVVDSIAGPIASLAQEVLKARDGFADAAIESLDALQKTLPFLCALNAAVVIDANGNASSLPADYVGIALPVPLEGVPSQIEDDEAVEQAGEEIEHNDAEVEELAADAEKAREEMETAKEEGYISDCGAAPSQYERASTLAGLSGVRNPWYSSVETWGFDVAIQRSQSYYEARIAQEAPDGNSVEAMTQSVARERFYRYALELVEQGYLSTVDGVTTAYMPFLPQNTEDMRGTYLYTESVYPVSTVDGKRVLHASPSCPACSSVEGYGALCDIDTGDLAECPVCDFSISSIGRTPAASTSIENGFEYHYKAVATAAQRYSEASREYETKTQEAKSTTNESMDAFSQALESFRSHRYDPSPPGRFGCVAIVLDPSTHTAPVAFGHLSASSVQIGPRVAISAAMLAPDDPVEGANIISSLLKGIAEGGSESMGLAVADRVVTLWGNMLLFYSNGTEGFIDAVGEFLSTIPGIGSELSVWAQERLEEILELAGLEPVKMESYKPVLVNSIDVLQHSDSGISELISGTRDAYTTLTSDHLLASVSFGEGFATYEIEIALPMSLAELGQEALAGVASGYGSGVSPPVTSFEAWR